MTRFGRCAGRRAALAAVLLAALAAGGVGCGRQAVPRAPADLPTELPSEEEAGRVTPASEEAIPLLPRDLRSPAATPAADSTTAAPAGTARRQHYGYRVQLFASSSEAVARQRADEFARVFAEPVYLDYEGLLYKVRVGDFVSRDEAEALRRRVAEAGYDGAFVVETEVYVR
jgi:cell division septation protein DedD